MLSFCKISHTLVRQKFPFFRILVGSHLHLYVKDFHLVSLKSLAAFVLFFAFHILKKRSTCFLRKLKESTRSKATVVHFNLGLNRRIRVSMIRHEAEAIKDTTRSQNRMVSLRPAHHRLLSSPARISYGSGSSTPWVLFRRPETDTVPSGREPASQRFPWSRSPCRNRSGCDWAAGHGSFRAVT
jgi:hypothetical protein